MLIQPLVLKCPSGIRGLSAPGGAAAPAQHPQPLKLIRRSFIGILSVLSLTLLAGCNSEALISSVIRKQIANDMPPAYTQDKEGITVVTVGTATPLPGERVQSGTAVFVNGYFFLFDVGAGVVQQCENLRFPLEELDGIFLTHYHSDHMMDLPNLISRSWLLGRSHELPVYGPNPLNSLVEAANGYIAIDNLYRLAHHGPGIIDTSMAKGIPHEFQIGLNATLVVFEQDGIKITAVDVTHEPIEPAVGYVIEYMGKKVVLSGDTKKNSLLGQMARDCDLLVHEVMLMTVQQIIEAELREAGRERDATLVHDIQDYHTSPGEVADLAQHAGAKRLVLNHLAPAPDNRLFRKLYLQEMKAYTGPIHLANDGDVFVVK